ncbi:hypothetical protein N431DRAFT_554551 [Stipitochalara longipes BDJ]|nr:hypothetical protein N431DRAFT_554551 [Stipitochalara longipes BDJ]
MESNPSAARATRTVHLRSPPWRTTGPHLTYEEVFMHLTSTGKTNYIHPEASMTVAPDGYTPHSWNVLTELDVVPPVVKKEGAFLHEAMAVIQAKTRPATAGAVRANVILSATKGDNAHAKQVAKDDNAMAKVSVEKGYGIHSAATTEAAKQKILNIREGFELHLEDSTLVGRRHQKATTGSSEGNGSDATIAFNTQATDHSIKNGIETGAHDAALQEHNTTTAAESTTPPGSPPRPTNSMISPISSPQANDPGASNNIPTGATESTIPPGSPTRTASSTIPPIYNPQANNPNITRETFTEATDTTVNKGNNTSTAGPSIPTTSATQAPDPTINNPSNPAPQPNLVPSTNFLFNHAHIPHSEKYLKLTESGFTSPWQLTPLGASLYLTVHGDTPTSSIDPDPVADAQAATVICSFISLPALPSPAIKSTLLRSFLLSGRSFTPDPEYITKIELIRGDTLFLPPLILHRFEYQHNTLTANGIFMLKQNLRISLESWKWDALSTLRRGFYWSRELLDAVMREIGRDPAGTGWDGRGKEQLVDDYKVIRERLDREWEESHLALQVEKQSVAKMWEVEREKKTAEGESGEAEVETEAVMKMNV